jgi:hypothetical protein
VGTRADLGDVPCRDAKSSPYPVAIPTALKWDEEKKKMIKWNEELENTITKEEKEERR